MMIPVHNICTFISRATISLLMLLLWPAAGTAQKLFLLEKDSIPLMCGFQVSFDLVGAVQLMVSDYGQYEGALRLNLHDQWFPVVEVGYGKAEHVDDPVTGLSYKTQAPYFKAGIDFNLLKKKHQKNRLFAGLRYAFTSYKLRRAGHSLLTALGRGCHRHRLSSLRTPALRLERALSPAVEARRRQYWQNMVCARLWHVRQL